MADELRARLAEAERERDCAIMAFRLATSLDSLSDEELHQLKANLQDVIDRSADSAELVQK